MLLVARSRYVPGPIAGTDSQAEPVPVALFRVDPSLRWTVRVRVAAAGLVSRATSGPEDPTWKVVLFEVPTAPVVVGRRKESVR